MFRAGLLAVDMKDNTKCIMILSDITPNYNRTSGLHLHSLPLVTPRRLHCLRS